MKKVYKLFVVLVACLFCTLGFAGCGEELSTRTLNMSVNPELTFVVDGNDKIVSVNYNNADAGKIFVNTNFVGKDVDSAVQIFIELSAISGHINLEQSNDFEIEVNGSVDADITELKNKVEKKAQEVFENLGVEVEFNVASLTKEAAKAALVATAKSLSPEKTTAELNEMTEEQLVELIKEKQKELADLTYTQVQSYLANFNAENLYVTAIQTARTALETAQTLVDNLPESLRQEAQTQLNQAKQAFEQAIEEFEQQKETFINNAKQAVAQAKTALETQFKNEVAQAKTAFMSHIDELKSSNEMTQQQYDYWKSLVEANQPAA